MRALERAEPEMHDAGRDRGPIVARPRDIMQQSAESCVGKPLHSLELVGSLRQIIREIARDLARLVLVEQMLHDEFGEVGAIDAPRHIMPRRDLAEGARIVLEADRIIEAGCLGGELPEAPHAFRRVVEPPRWPQFEDRIVACERC